MRIKSEPRHRAWLEDASSKEDNILLPSPPLQKSSPQCLGSLQSSTVTFGRQPAFVPCSLVSIDSQEFSISDGSDSAIAVRSAAESDDEVNIIMEPYLYHPTAACASDEFVLNDLKALLNSQGLSSGSMVSSPFLAPTGNFINDTYNSYHSTMFENFESMDFDIQDVLATSKYSSKSGIDNMAFVDTELALFPQLHRS
ncbi:hypothetical protein BDF20DRAFT_127607 [Mycotypha africana]|uniref:uncharacterized protein n=1 Tax=Mycotypha africana TaxID=64632 RepID=UPI002301E1AA|nr:uncharacterized protein BDF20DRAFT_127607 [Mycotypha africana]KAI8970486.1 hypothetical protein BDF20DRAFT_127607 [Mycotypha africana]